MYFSEKEDMIIGKFFSHIWDLADDDLLELIWEGFKLTATLDTAFDDHDEETDEEFNSLVFKLIKQEGDPTFADLQGLKDGDLFIVNYRNFPKEIRLNGEVIG